MVNHLKIKDKHFGMDSIFTSHGKLALMFLKSYTKLSDSMLLKQLNANYQFQLFCGMYIVLLTN